MENRRKVVCYIAESLDGYIATEDDSLEWLFKSESEDGGDAGYAEFMENIDTLIMGRRTYDWVMEAESGNYPYQELTSYVFTSSPAEENPYVNFTNQEILRFMEDLKKRPGKDIWVIGGSKLLNEFVKEDLIDEWIISIAPVLIGKGIPLFQKFDSEIRLKLQGVKMYGQFAQLHYGRA